MFGCCITEEVTKFLKNFLKFHKNEFSAEVLLSINALIEQTQETSEKD